MQDTELYRQLLGLNTPWTVTRVELKVKEQRVDVWAGHGDRATWMCPECGTVLALYDHADERTWLRVSALLDGVAVAHVDGMRRVGRSAE